MKGERSAASIRRRKAFALAWRLLLGILFLSPLIVGLVFSFEPDSGLVTLPPLP